MVNPALDPVPCREALRRDGYVQVADYLQPAAAERLRVCLQHEVPWALALQDGNGARTIGHATYAAMDEYARERLFATVARSGRDGTDAESGFRFVYDSYMMVASYKEGRDPGLLLHRVLELFNSPEYIALARALTGDARVRRVNAQATRYRPGQFLREHTDVDTREGRLYAYVLNLSRDWRADWGGLLQFIGDRGEVTGTLLPRWNTLSLFTVPTGHAVSLVAPWAREDRLSITGWLLL
jgi:SM-20-related protein